MGTSPWSSFQDRVDLPHLDRKQGRPSLLQGSAEQEDHCAAKQASYNLLWTISGFRGREVLKSAKDLILRLRTEDESSKSLAAAMEEVRSKQQQLEAKLDSLMRSLESVVAKLT